MTKLQYQALTELYSWERNILIDYLYYSTIEHNQRQRALAMKWDDLRNKKVERMRNDDYRVLALTNITLSRVRKPFS